MIIVDGESVSACWTHSLTDISTYDQTKFLSATQTDTMTNLIMDMLNPAYVGKKQAFHSVQNIWRDYSAQSVIGLDLQLFTCFNFNLTLFLKLNLQSHQLHTPSCVSAHDSIYLL